MTIVQDDIVTLTQLTLADAPFIFQLMNEPSYIRYIGDRNITDLPAAEQYLINGPLKSYEQYGFGLWKCSLTSNKEVVGVCGLIKRDYLKHPDIGYATLEQYHGRGYTSIAMELVIDQARSTYQLDTLMGITDPSNQVSQHLLMKHGFSIRETSIINNLETTVFERTLSPN